jgi:phosphatidate phosphatase APP1
LYLVSSFSSPFWRSSLVDTIDVDNTIKKRGTTALDVLQIPFYRTSLSIPDMPELYRHIVSVLSPTWFYLTANPLLNKSCICSYPAGEFLSREVSPQSLGSAILPSTMAGILAFKREMLDKIHTIYPKKSFILVGDSLEEDPEAYAAQ